VRGDQKKKNRVGPRTEVPPNGKHHGGTEREKTVNGGLPLDHCLPEDAETKKKKIPKRRRTRSNFIRRSLKRSSFNDSVQKLFIQIPTQSVLSNQEPRQKNRVGASFCRAEGGVQNRKTPTRPSTRCGGREKRAEAPALPGLLRGAEPIQRIGRVFSRVLNIGKPKTTSRILSEVSQHPILSVQSLARYKEPRFPQGGQQGKTAQGALFPPGGNEMPSLAKKKTPSDGKTKKFTKGKLLQWCQPIEKRINTKFLGEGRKKEGERRRCRQLGGKLNKKEKNSNGP